MPRYHPWITVPTGGTPAEEEIPADVIEEEITPPGRVEEKTIANEEVPVLDMTQLVPVKYDTITMEYAGEFLKIVKYRTGGRKGKIIAKLFLLYDKDSNLSSVQRS